MSNEIPGPFPVASKTLAEAKVEMLAALELNNVANIADADKIVSDDTQIELDLKANLAGPTTFTGTTTVATLVVSGASTLTGAATAVNLTVSGTFSAKIAGAIGSPLKIGASNVISEGEFGDGSGEFCEGDDVRVVGAVQSNITQGGTGSEVITNIVSIPNAAYNLLAPPNATTLYIITADP